MRAFLNPHVRRDDTFRGLFGDAEYRDVHGYFAAHPELRTRLEDEGKRPTLLGIALHFEKQHGSEVMRPVMDWLAANGFDRQLALNVRLCGKHGPGRSQEFPFFRGLIIRCGVPLPFVGHRRKLT